MQDKKEIFEIIKKKVLHGIPYRTLGKKIKSCYPVYFLAIL